MNEDGIHCADCQVVALDEWQDESDLCPACGAREADNDYGDMLRAEERDSR